MNDLYNFEKSNKSQSIISTPYEDKQYAFIPDLQNAVYQNNSSNTMVSFDASSIFNSTQMVNMSESFTLLPVVMCAAFTNGSQALYLNPNKSNDKCNYESMMSLKSNNVNLVNQVNIQINGKSIEENQSLVNFPVNFKMLSEMSPSDLKQYGKNIGIPDVLDNDKSVIFDNFLSAKPVNNGTGFTNNIPWGNSGILGIPDGSALKVVTQGAFNEEQNQNRPIQNQNVCNGAIRKKINKYADLSKDGNIYRVQSGDNIDNNLVTEYITKFNFELKPYFYIDSGNQVMYWVDYVVIRFKDMFDSMANLCMSKRLDLRIDMFLNTGFTNITLGGLTGSTVNSGLLTYRCPTAQNTFINTCPYTVNYSVNDINANGGLLGTEMSLTGAAPYSTTPTNFVCGLFIGNRPPSLSIAGVNFASLNPPNTGLNQCRLYYPKIVLDATVETSYIQKNLAKNIVYRKINFNTTETITPGNNYSKILNSGIVNAYGVLIVPLYDKSNYKDPTDQINQYQSPFDTCGFTTSNISLINLSCELGGSVVNYTPLNYTYENWLEQVSLFESISSDLGANASMGLLNQEMWENAYRNYYIDLSRVNINDRETPKSIKINFQNNTKFNITCLIYIYTIANFKINVGTGLIVKQ
jgi:hypothetical protein